MGAPQDQIERIVVRLDLSEPIERAIFERYQQKSRSRRQEWIREVMESGFVALGLCPDSLPRPGLRQVAGVAGVPHAAPPSASPASPLEVSASSAPDTVGAPARMDSPPLSSEPIAPAPIAANPVPGRQSTSVLKGFLPALSPTLDRGTSS